MPNPNNPEVQKLMQHIYDRKVSFNLFKEPPTNPMIEEEIQNIRKLESELRMVGDNKAFCMDCSKTLL